MIDLSLLVLLAIAQTPAPVPEAAPEQQPASQPSSVVSGSAGDVRADLALIIETSETDLSIQEGWTLIGPSDRQIPVPDLKIEMPTGGRLLQLDEKARGFKVNEAMSGIVGTEPLIGTQQLNMAYLYPKAGSSLHLARVLPYTVSTGRVIVQDLPGLEVNLSMPATRRERDLNGQNFLIYDFGQLTRGTELRVTITGFPAKAVWPRRIAAFLAFAIIGWMFWAISTKSVPGRTGATAVSPVSARARRDQILKAIEVLETELAAEKVKPKKYERRHAELMKELADALHEIELSAGA